MLSLFGSLAMTITKPQQAPRRAQLTPGQLYRILSSEFRLHRSPRCTCRMPMIYACERPAEGAANWNVEPLARRCGECQALVDRLVAHFCELYDVRDPESWGVAADPAADESFSAGKRIFG